MSLENLLEQIEKDAHKKAKLIEDDANREAQALINDATQTALSKKQKIIEESKQRAELQREARLAKARLEAKDLILQNKRDAIDKAFEKALTALNNTKDEEFNSLVLDILVNNTNGAVKAAISSPGAEKIVQKANEILTKQGRKASLEISKDKVDDKGFILIDKNGATADFTFKSLIDHHKEELERAVFLILSEREINV